MYDAWAYDYDDEWILANIDRFKNNRELYNAYMECHDANIKWSTFRKHICNKLGVTSRRTITDEEKLWIIENDHRFETAQDLACAFNKEFGKNRTEGSMHAIRGQLNLTRKALPVLSVYTTTDGRNRIKVGTGRRGHIDYPRYVFEKEYGKLPRGYAVIHIDNDKLNDSIDNLIAVPSGWLGTMQRYEWFSDKKEITKAALLWCELRAVQSGGKRAIGIDRFMKGNEQYEN